MSARRPIARPLADFLPLTTPTRPVLARPRCTSMPQRGEPVGDQLRGAVLLEGELGMGVDVAPDVRQLGVVGADLLDGDAIFSAGAFMAFLARCVQ